MLWASDLHRLPPHPDTEQSLPTLPGPALDRATGWWSDILGARHFTVDPSHLPQLPLPCTSQVRILTLVQDKVTCSVQYPTVIVLGFSTHLLTPPLLFFPMWVHVCIYSAYPAYFLWNSLAGILTPECTYPLDTLFLKSWEALKTRCAGMLRPILLWRSKDSSQTYTSRSQ